MAGVLDDMGAAHEICASAGQLLGRLPDVPGAALVAEEALTPAVVDALADLLARQPSWSDLPLVILTGSGAVSPASVRVVHRLAPVANVTLLERPVRTVTPQSAVRAALRARRRQYEVRDHLAEGRWPASRRTWPSPCRPPTSRR
ncbi:MAG TPA: hypothetical protein VNN07_00305 [Candidatus Tectomicrobia bacterium]|nr:hypothetical protein [Candidatus Tectomicrobia bacterium]